MSWTPDLSDDIAAMFAALSTVDHEEIAIRAHAIAERLRARGLRAYHARARKRRVAIPIRRPKIVPAQVAERSPQSLRAEAAYARRMAEKVAA